MVSTHTRRLHVLQAIVVEHVQTNEPVSSKVVAEDHVTGVSSATIRSDMSVLEDQGLIHQPHTSAGRVPTEAGYRQYVDHLSQTNSLNTDSRQQIEKQLSGANDYNEIIDRTVRLLARLTRQAAVVEYPDLSLAGIRRVELIDLYANRVLVLVVSTSGRVAERQLDVPSAVAIDSEALDRAAQVLTDLCQGLGIRQARSALKHAAEGLPESQALIVTMAAQVLREMLRPIAVSRVVTAGASNLTRSGVDFSDVSSVLEALEEQAAIVQVLGEIHTGPVDVTIGAENQVGELAEASVVSATYNSAEAGAAHVGVVGPTRMDYPRSLAAVRAVSRCLSQILLAETGETPDQNQTMESAKEGTA